MKLRTFNHGVWMVIVITASMAFVLQIKGTRARGDCVPTTGCSIALAYYVVSATESLSSIADRFQVSMNSIVNYNSLPDINSIATGQSLSIPFPCDCKAGQLGHVVSYRIVNGDTLDIIAHAKFKNLSRSEWVQAANDQVDVFSLTPSTILNIPLNCSCGNPDVSSSYGLFTSYVAQEGDNIATLSSKFGIESRLLSEYNTDLNLDNLWVYRDIIFAPAKDGNGAYPPFNISADGDSGSHRSAIIGGSVGGGLLFMTLSVALLVFLSWKRKAKAVPIDQKPILGTSNSSSIFPRVSQKSIVSAGLVSPSSVYSLDKIIEFTYEELVEMTSNFDHSKEIGRGGFGAVFYGEVNKMKLAIKMMDMKEEKQFMAELKVLARVHHSNLVKLVGYCTANQLFLVYEYVENGTLKFHLDAPKEKGTPLSWASRIEIALDAARGLEYIHEHATPTYVHLDIKPENILLDNNLRAKIADFGLAKLSEAIGTVHLAGTRGYMAPEYATCGEISPKVDVYSFGVVLMQLISAKGPIDFINNREDKKALPTLFEEFFEEPQAKDKLNRIVDPALEDLEDHYAPESMWKMMRLAARCTDIDPGRRPSIRNVISSLMSLTSSTQEWELSAALKERHPQFGM